MIYKLIKAFNFPETITDREKLEFNIAGHVLLSKALQVEHTGTVDVTAPNLVSWSAANFETSDRSKYIKLKSSANFKTYYIKAVTDSSNVVLNTQNVTTEVAAPFELLGFERSYYTSATISSLEWSPNDLKELKGFKEKATKPAGTSIVYRLNDGTNDLYWSGAAWSPTTLDAHWSPALDIDANIGTFPATKRLKVVAKLASDGTATPVLEGVIVPYEAETSFHSDLWESLIDYLGINATDYVEDDMAATTSVTLSDLLDQEQAVVDVIAVYNLTTDSTTDVLSSYAGGVVTFTSAQTGVVRIIFTYKPNVRFWVHQDFINIEQNLVPTIAISRVSEEDRIKLGGFVQAGDEIYYPPEQVMLRVDLRLYTQRMRTLMRLGEAVEQKVRVTPNLTSKGLGEEYSLRVTEGMTDRTTSNLSDLREGEITVEIFYHSRWYDDPNLTYRIETVNYNL